MKRDEIRVTRTKIFQLVRVRGLQFAQESKRIRVPGRRVQVFGQLEMIKAQESSHEIMKDRPARRETADDLDLQPVETYNLIRRKAHEVELVSRIRFSNGEIC